MHALSMLLALATTAHAACPNPTAPSDVDREIKAAEFAFQDMDEPGFRSALDRARQQAACLSEPLSPEIAAALHRHEGYEAWLRDDDEAALSAFIAAIRLAPDYDLPLDLAPMGNPLRVLYEEASARAPADPMPSLSPPDARALTDAPPPERPEPAATPRRRPVRLALAAGGAGLSAATLYGLSVASARAFERPDELDDDLDVLAAARRANHAQVGAAAGLGAVAIGLGAAAALQVQW